MKWACPFCGHIQTITHPKYSQKEFAFEIEGVPNGPFGLRGTAIGCSNPECSHMQIDVEVVEARRNTHGIYSVPYGCATITRLCITPESSARPQPSYIPLALVEDYNEACRIRDLSPKAAATLARRCIQGMIRDFAGVKGRTLYDEITALKMMVEKDEAPRGVSIESVEAIDHIRSIGNIGAHMEKDIDLIIPVEPEEAQVLIELIESLFEEWYIERYRRQQRFAAINNIASEKAALKLLPTSQSRE